MPQPFRNEIYWRRFPFLSRGLRESAFVSWFVILTNCPWVPQSFRKPSFLPTPPPQTFCFIQTENTPHLLPLFPYPVMVCEFSWMLPNRMKWEAGKMLIISRALNNLVQFNLNSCSLNKIKEQCTDKESDLIPKRRAVSSPFQLPPVTFFFSSCSLTSAEGKTENKN